MKKEKMSFLEYFMNNHMIVSGGMFFLFALTIWLEIYRGSDEWYYSFFYLAICLITPVASYVSWRIKHK